MHGGPPNNKDKPPAQGRGHDVEQGTSRTPDQPPAQSQEQRPAQSPGQTPAQSPEQRPTESPGQTPTQSPGQKPTQPPQQLTDARQEKSKPHSEQNPEKDKQDAAPAEDEDGTDYEIAFELTGHGCFNRWALLASTFIFLHSWYEMVAMGFVISAAECDLDLNMAQKSLINSAVFMGVLMTSILWGELSDHLGRRYIMLPTELGAVLASITSSLSVNFWMMFCFRFITGCMISATSAISMVYLGEMHTDRHRDKAFTNSFVIAQSSFMVLPLVGWVILTGKWSFALGALNIKPWRTFMWTWAAVGFAGFLILAFLPESPRYIVAHAGPIRARPVLAQIYARNFHKKVSDYPIKVVTTSIMLREQQHGFLKVLKEIFGDMGLLFKPPLFRCFFFSHFCMFNTFLVANGLYVWLPDIINKAIPDITGDTSLCDLINSAYLSATDVWLNSPITPYAGGASGMDPCEPPNYEVYPMSMGVEFVYMVPYIAVMVLIDKIDKAKLYAIITWISTAFLMISSFAPKMWIALICYMVAPSTSSCYSILSALAMDAFPTKLRALTMGTMYMCGQVGAVVGTSVIAFMYDRWCFIIFAAICTTITASTVALVFMWPNMATVRKIMEAKGFGY